MILSHDQLTLKNCSNHGIPELGFIQSASLHPVGFFKTLNVLLPVDVVLEVLEEGHGCGESEAPHAWTLEQGRCFVVGIRDTSVWF